MKRRPGRGGSWTRRLATLGTRHALVDGPVPRRQYCSCQRAIECHKLYPQRRWCRLSFWQQGVALAPRRTRGNNILATSGNPTSFTMLGAEWPLSRRKGTYPGSFLNDPNDNSSPSILAIGRDGIATNGHQRATAADQKTFARWSGPGTRPTVCGTTARRPFLSAAERFLALERGMLGRAQATCR